MIPSVLVAMEIPKHVQVVQKIPPSLMRFESDAGQQAIPCGPKSLGLR